MAIDAVNVRGLKNNPSEALEKATHGPVVVLKGDKPTAVLLSLEGVNVDGDLRPDLARAFYEAGVLSLGKAARVAGMSYGEFVTLLSHSGVPVVRYSDEELQRELDVVGRW
jgi:predicted HTH domain antitoxin